MQPGLRPGHPRDHPELARRRSPTRCSRRMRKTAMSAIIYEVLDLGTGITDADGEIAVVRRRHPGVRRRARQGGEGDPAPSTRPGPDRARRRLRHQRSLLRRRHPSQRHHSHHAGVRRGRLVAWTANIAHWNDVGGMVPGSMSTDAHEIFQEGLRMPGVKLIDAGQAEPGGHRHHDGQFPPAATFSSATCGRASPRVRVGERRIARAVRKYGADDVRAGARRLHGLRRAAGARGARRLPKGRFSSPRSRTTARSIKRHDRDHRRRRSLSICSDNPDQVAGPDQCQPRRRR